jgi:hypothetical protein
MPNGAKAGASGAKEFENGGAPLPVDGAPSGSRFDKPVGYAAVKA